MGRAMTAPTRRSPAGPCDPDVELAGGTRRRRDQLERLRDHEASRRRCAHRAGHRLGDGRASDHPARLRREYAVTTTGSSSTTSPSPRLRPLWPPERLEHQFGCPGATFRGRAGLFQDPWSGSTGGSMPTADEYVAPWTTARSSDSETAVERIRSRCSGAWPRRSTGSLEKPRRRRVREQYRWPSDIDFSTFAATRRASRSRRAHFRSETRRTLSRRRRCATCHVAPTSRCRIVPRRI